jgi:arylsulfatase
MYTNLGFSGGMGSLRLFLLLKCLGLSLVILTFACADGVTRPNVVLILCDDLGFSDLGCYGGEISTPNLDRLATEGMRFSQFYNDGKCTQTRAALLSGLYYHQSNNLITRNHVTLAEVLQQAGYQTLMVGKWHVGCYSVSKPETWSVEDQPTRRGFDRYFGFLTGAINFFSGREFRTGRNVMVLDEKKYDVPEDFYSTTAFTDHAIQFLNEAAEREDPFFLYLAYNAPHFPLHALPGDIDQYVGRYMEGWDVIRNKRYDRMLAKGLIDARWPLTLRDEIVPDWNSLTDSERQEEDLLMAVYAAMVHRLDRGIGRILDSLDRLHFSQNTVVMFLSDNGGCCWAANRKPESSPGPEESTRSYDTEWANVSNTPFRLYKQYSHEGGISTPFLVRWPAAIEAGSTTDEVGHLIDVMPTILEVTGAHYPDRFNNHSVLPLEGRSLMPALRGKNRPDAPIFWEFNANHAMRLGRWKLVAERSLGWELYDMDADRCELNNLVEQEPQVGTKLARMYDQWATRVGAKTHAECLGTKPSAQTCYLHPVTREELNRAQVLKLRNEAR